MSLSSRLLFWSFCRGNGALSWPKSATLLMLSLSWPWKKQKIFAETILKIQWKNCFPTVNRLNLCTFAAPVLPFVPPSAALAGGLAAGGEVGLGRRLAPALVGLCDGGGVDRVAHAAEAFLRAPVKVRRRVGALGGEGGRGRSRFLRLLRFVAVRLLGPAGRSRFLKKVSKVHHTV